MKAQYQLDTLFVETEKIGVEEGLSAGYLYDIAQDKNGFIWFATMQGLNRWDGYEMKEYINDANNSNSLPNNRVKAIHFDRDGLLWVIHAEGLSIFDPIQEEFIKTQEHSTVFSSGAIIEGLNDDDIYIPEIPMDWTVFIKDSIENKLILESYPIENHYKGLPSNVIKSSIAFTDDQEIYFIHIDTLYGYKLDTVDNTTSKFFTLAIDPAQIHNRNYLMTHYDTGNVWYFGLETFLEIETYGQKSINEYKYPAEFRSPQVVPIKSISNGRFLMSNSQQLFIIDPINEQCTVFADHVSKSTVLTGSNNAKRFLLDSQNILWAATTGSGVDKFDLNESKFRSLPAPTNSVFEVQLIPNNVISINGSGQFYNYKKTDDQHPYRIKNDEIKQTMQFGCVIVSDRKDILLVINRHSRRSSSKDNFWKFNEKLELLDGWSHQDLFDFEKNYTGERYFLFEDNSLGVISVSDENSEILKVLKWDYTKIDTTTEYIYPNLERESMSYEMNKPFSTGDGVVLFPTNEAGLFSLNPKSRKWTRSKKSNNNDSGLMSNQILTVVEDQSNPDSILWIGTGAGLHRFNRIDSTYEVFNKRHGLPNQVIYGILQDENDRLWLSTNNGLCRFDYKTRTTRNFTTADGLTHNEFNKNCAVKDTNGIMYFGGIKGVNYFDPKDFDQDSVDIPICITSLKVNDTYILSSTDYQDKSLNGILIKPIEHTEELVLNYKHKMIAFEFTLLAYTNPEENQFVYKLEGFNDDWIDAKTVNQATFTNLPKGDYTFKVKAKNHEDIWSTQMAKINITVLPPIWDTWWFKVFVLSVIILGIYSLFKYRIRQNKKLENLRNRISQDLHDEIGSTLSSISLFGTVAQKMSSTDQKTTINMLERINTSTTQVMESINDIVWAINSENDKLENLIMRMRAYISELSDASEVRVSMNIDDSIKSSSLGMIQKRNIYLIFKESINNAFKYAKASAIDIELKEKNKRIILSIKDDGIGFNPSTIYEEASLGGNGLRNIKKRAKEVDGTLKIISSEGSGTEISFQWNPNLSSNKNL